MLSHHPASFSKEFVNTYLLMLMQNLDLVKMFFEITIIVYKILLMVMCSNFCGYLIKYSYINY